MAASGDGDPRQRCYNEWMELQQVEHSELLQALNLGSNLGENETESSQLVQRMIKHYEDYVGKRARLARDSAALCFAPPYYSSLEKLTLWIGGCRPSSYIRLIYALCGLETTESEPTAEFVNQIGEQKLSALSSQQLTILDKIHRKTIRQEERLTSRKASLQEDMADHPFAGLATKSDSSCELSREARSTIEEKQREMASVQEEADLLRLSTTKEIINMLKPFQALQFLAAGKKLAFCMQDWGKREDLGHDQHVPQLGVGSIE